MAITGHPGLPEHPSLNNFTSASDTPAEAATQPVRYTLKELESVGKVTDGITAYEEMTQDMTFDKSMSPGFKIFAANLFTREGAVYVPADKMPLSQPQVPHFVSIVNYGKDNEFVGLHPANFKAFYAGLTSTDGTKGRLVAPATEVLGMINNEYWQGTTGGSVSLDEMEKSGLPIELVATLADQRYHAGFTRDGLLLQAMSLIDAENQIKKSGAFTPLGFSGAAMTAYSDASKLSYLSAKELKSMRANPSDPRGAFGKKALDSLLARSPEEIAKITEKFVALHGEFGGYIADKWATNEAKKGVNVADSLRDGMKGRYTGSKVTPDQISAHPDELKAHVQASAVSDIKDAGDLFHLSDLVSRDFLDSLPDDLRGKVENATPPASPDKGESMSQVERLFR